MINIPNAITLVRILMVPLFLSFLAEGSMDLALIVFVTAGVSDGI
ncbi:MAG: CDP-diacylglycerol--glycerol-3-phosphate 3-phosphatidyltransferase, partial [Myxococcales bacterium]